MVHTFKYDAVFWEPFLLLPLLRCNFCSIAFIPGKVLCVKLGLLRLWKKLQKKSFGAPKKQVRRYVRS